MYEESDQQLAHHSRRACDHQATSANIASQPERAPTCGSGDGGDGMRRSVAHASVMRREEATPEHCKAPTRDGGDGGNGMPRSVARKRREARGGNP